MSSFGENLRRERERRDTPLEVVADKTRIGLQYLQALENNEFEGLPGQRGFGKLYIRAYAEMLGFDPAPLIEQYDEERLRRLHASGEIPATEPVRRTRRVRYRPPVRVSSEIGDDPDELQAAPDDEGPVADRTAAQEVDSVLDSVFGESGGDGDDQPEQAVPPPGRAPISGRLIAAAVAAVVLLIVVGVFLATRQPTTDVAAVSEPAEEIAAPAPALQDDAPVPVPVPVPVPDPGPSAEPTPVAEPPAPRAPLMPESPLHVISSGVGKRVVDLRLVDRGDRFAEGSIVSYLTRIEGGVPGQPISHAWLREGRLVQRISLTLGGSSWRTYSNKTLWGTGHWTVEVHDDAGRVLASETFNCVRSDR